MTRELSSIQGVHLTRILAEMERYNLNHVGQIRDNLISKCQIAYQDRWQENYEKNREYFKQHFELSLPEYKDLPLEIFQLTANFNVIYDKENDKFLLGEHKNFLFEFYSALLLGMNRDQVVEKYNRYWHEQESADLYKKIVSMQEKNIYTPLYIKLVEAFWQCSQDVGLTNYFLGRYYFAQRDFNTALDCFLTSKNARQYNPQLMYEIAKTYEALNDFAEAAIWYTRYISHNLEINKSMQFSFSRKISDFFNNNKATGENSLVNIMYAPFYRKINLKREGLLDAANTYAGDYLYHDRKMARDFFVGFYPHGAMGSVYKLFETIFSQGDNQAETIRNFDFTYDFMKVIGIEKEIEIEPEQGETLILPLTNVDGEVQDIAEFSHKHHKAHVYLGKNEFSFFRIAEKTKIKATCNLAVGYPIRLGHSPKRKKLVLNLLLDAMSWGWIKTRNYKDVPNIFRFFSKGIIFNNHFSISEYTYPSLATIETGLAPHHSQIINNGYYTELAPEHLTISEQMKKLGYYCTTIMGDTEGIYNGVSRGYDRIIANHILLDANTAVKRLIDHLEAFAECDNFVFCHITDVHPFNKKEMQVTMPTQTKLSLEDRTSSVNGDTSVNLGKTELNVTDNNYRLHRLDTILAGLFDYIETHYDEDEYIINLYSDHGTSVYSDKLYYLSEFQNGAAFMMRGSGINPVGLVEELTNTSDIYPVLANLVDFAIPIKVDGILPRCFGGLGRDYTVSNSIFPGQTYKLCIRTADYEYRIETKDFTKNNGTINLDGCKQALYRRGNDDEEIYDDVLREMFWQIALSYTKDFNIAKWYPAEV